MTIKKHDFIGRNRAFLFEIEADDNHLGVSLVHRFGENQGTGVGDVITQTIDDVGESVSKLDFGDELEEGIIEVATETHFKKTVEAVVEQVPAFFHYKPNPTVGIIEP